MPRGGRIVRRDTLQREALFIAAYLQHMNGARAIREAGYRLTNVKNQARLSGILLKRPHIRAAVLAAQAKQVKAFDIDAIRVKREIAAIAFLDPAGCFDPDGRPLLLHDMPPEVRAAVKSVQVTALDNRAVACKVEFWSKTDALNLAAKHLNLLAPKEVTITHRFPHAHLTDAELKQKLLEASNTIEAEGAPCPS